MGTLHIDYYRASSQIRARWGVRFGQTRNNYRELAAQQEQSSWVVSAVVRQG